MILTDEIHDRLSVEMDRDEYRTLAWLADRYTCADFLWLRTNLVGAYGPTEVHRLTLDEDEALEYVGLLVDENGNPDQRVPPCAGGTLAEKLDALLSATDHRWGVA